MKKKNKLSRIGSALLAIMLVIGMAAADVEPVHAAEEGSTIDVSEDKTTLDGASIFNFFGLGENKVEADDKGVVKSSDVEIKVDGSAKEVIDNNKDANTKRNTTVKSSVVANTTTDTSRPGLVDSLKNMFSGNNKADSPMSYTISGDTITITSIGTDSLAQGSTLLTDIPEAEYIRNVRFTAPVDLPANAFKGSNIVTVTGQINSIGDSAFYNCHNLESIDLSKCKTIGKNAFTGDELGENDARYGLNKLTSVDLSGCTNIGDNAFSYNEQLIYITVPTSGCTISASAFQLGYMYTKDNNGTTEFHYSTSPQTGKGEQLLTRTYFIGNATGSNYQGSLWTANNREVIWDDTEVDFILSDKYETGAVPTNDDFEVYVSYDYGQPGKYTPELKDGSLNREITPEKVSHTTTITNVPASGGGVGSNYKIEFQYQRSNGTSISTYKATKYLNIIARTLTDNIVITATDSYPEGTKGLVSFTWTDESNTVSLPFYVKAAGKTLEMEKQGLLIPIGDDEMTFTLHRTQSGAAEATFTISAKATDISAGDGADPIKSWQLSVKDASVTNGEYTTKNLASGNGGTDIPMLGFIITTGSSSGGTQPTEPDVPETGLAGTIVDKDGDGIPGLRVVVGSTAGTPVTEIVMTGENGEFSFDHVSAGTKRLYILNSNYKQGSIFTGNWNAYFTLSEVTAGGWMSIGGGAHGSSSEAGAVWSTSNLSYNIDKRVVSVRIGSTKADITGPSDSEIEWSKERLTITGKFLDKNGTPIADKYIALDTWSNAKCANKDGTYTFYVTDEKTHRIYFTNLPEKAENNAFNTNDIVNYVTFQTKKDEVGNYTVILDEGGSSLNTTRGKVDQKEYGSKWVVNVNTTSINNDIETPDIDGVILNDITVALDGLEGKTFTPYIGRKLTKDDFTVTAHYRVIKGQNPDYEIPEDGDIDWNQYYLWDDAYETLEQKDWTCDKLVSTDGVVVTKGKQTFMFTYTYNGKTVKEPIIIDGTNAPVAYVNGILKDANGKGMSNYIVYLDVYDNSTMTDSEGKFAFDDVLDGTYTLYVTKSKKASTSVGEVSSSIDTWFKTTVTVTNGKPQASSTKNGDGVTSVNKVRDNEITFTIVYDPETTIKVNVKGTFKSSEDKAITDQYIVLDDWSNAVKADSKGNFSFDNLEAGTYVLHFTNKNNKGSGSLGSSDYDYAKVNITIDQDKVEAKSTTYDGTTVDAKVDDGDLVINVKLSQQAEEKGTSNDTPTNSNTANSKVTAGEGKVEIKGVVTDANGNGKSGLAVVIDDYSKSVDTSSTGTFSITGVEDGSHTIAIHNVDKSKLSTSGSLNASDEKVLASYNVTVANGKVSAQNIGTNNVGQYAFSKENDDTVLNITTTLKAEQQDAANGTTTTGTDSTTASTTTATTNLLPKTGLDFLEQTGITDGIAKIVGYDSPIVAMLTPADTSVDENGNLVSRVSPTTIGGSNIGVAGIIMLIVAIVGGIAVCGLVWFKHRKENESSEG